MDIQTATTGNPTAATPVAELTTAELMLVAGGHGNATYNLFYEVGYLLGTAAGWVSDAFTSINNAYAGAVEQSNGAIMMNT